MLNNALFYFIYFPLLVAMRTYIISVTPQDNIKMSDTMDSQGLSKQTKRIENYLSFTKKGTTDHHINFVLEFYQTKHVCIKGCNKLKRRYLPYILPRKHLRQA